MQCSQEVVKLRGLVELPMAEFSDADCIKSLYDNLQLENVNPKMAGVTVYL